MKKILVIISILFLFASCKQTFKNKNEELRFEDIEKVIFSGRIETQCSYFEPFEITDKKLIEKFIKNINNSSLDELWKGACNSEIKIITNDSTLIFLTFDEVFSYSGKWYRYPEKDILEKLRNENKKLTINLQEN
ncbi:hypothetical protein [Aureivirga sp. CE67]|uniref:hypothetical protein n=1 Tax=Aureivirga sp. CE67 TaxID=1788983 RepID=UPI0018CBDB40|nr:hypothetical protein [Aureivirga sp. CE67]